MQRIYTILFAVVAVNAVVFPNAFKELLVISLFLAAALSFFRTKSVDNHGIVLFFISAAATAFYCIIGAFRGAPVEGVGQAIIIYIISPMLWLLAIRLLFMTYDLHRIVFSLSVLAVGCAASVALYYTLYLTFGGEAVSFFGSRANINTSEENTEIIIHVVGSLIFLAAGFVASPGVIINAYFRYFVILSIIVSIFACGRTAAVLAIVTGGLFYLFSKPKLILNNIFKFSFSALFVLAASHLIISFMIGSNLFSIVSEHFNKIFGGDSVRGEQIHALLTEASNIYFLGAGHGLGVNYIRSADFPWRYEAVYFALIYKLGVAGFISVSLAPIYAFVLFMRKYISHVCTKYDLFFGSAMTATLIAGVTNPYIEAFTFQWMILLPTYYFIADALVNRRYLFRKHAEAA